MTAMNSSLKEKTRPLAVLWIISPVHTQSIRSRHGVYRSRSLIGPVLGVEGTSGNSGSGGPTMAW
jgi:hypothetical protein